MVLFVDTSCHLPTGESFKHWQHKRADQVPRRIDLLGEHLADVPNETCFHILQPIGFFPDVVDETDFDWSTG